MKKYKKWQEVPNSIKTEKVQYWSKNGIMITAEITKDVASALVRRRHCFVISEQAIGQR